MKRVMSIFAGILFIFGLIVYLSAQDFHKDYSYIFIIQINELNHLDLNVNDIKGGRNFDPQHGCDTQTYARSRWPISDDRTKAMLQVAIASAISHTKVHVWTHGCTSPEETGVNSRPVLYSLQLEVPY
jgi:hypothetical protein